MVKSVGVHAAVLVIGFFSAKATAVLRRTVHWEPQSLLLVASAGSPTLLPGPYYLCMLQHFPPLGGMRPKWVPCPVPPKARGPGGWDGAGKAILFLLPLLCGGSQVSLFHCVAC